MNEFTSENIPQTVKPATRRDLSFADAKDFDIFIGAPAQPLSIILTECYPAPGPRAGHFPIRPYNGHYPVRPYSGHFPVVPYNGHFPLRPSVPGGYKMPNRPPGGYKTPIPPASIR